MQGQEPLRGFFPMRKAARWAHYLEGDTAMEITEKESQSKRAFGHLQAHTVSGIPVR